MGSKKDRNSTIAKTVLPKLNNALSGPFKSARSRSMAKYGTMQMETGKAKRKGSDLFIFNNVKTLDASLKRTAQLVTPLFKK